MHIHLQCILCVVIILTSAAPYCTLPVLHPTAPSNHNSVSPPCSASAETSPASHGVASARPYQFSCFFLKLPFQRMAKSAPLEVCRVKRPKVQDIKSQTRLDAENILLSVFGLLRALSFGLQDCANREPPGTRNTHQSRLQ